MYDKPSVDWGESELASLFRSPFLVPSLLVHGALLLIALRGAALTIPLPESTRQSPCNCWKGAQAAPTAKALARTKAQMVRGSCPN